MSILKKQFDRALEKRKALAEYLETELDNIAMPIVDTETFVYGPHEYLVLTDEEATQKAKEYIRESLWAFNPEFIYRFTGLEGLPTYDFIQAFREMQLKLCESSNELIYALVKDRYEDFVNEAISSDGRGHFITSYDGKEHEHGNYFIYQMD